ncbi:MAG TPA: PaaX family transcriptional regulator C-terminal domain-containing protein [Rugosimonospora sp.]|nr:PaaX family transcriptional regulator C-terminal domain-containing protein [Rugosimonospora sp.]
MISEEVDPRADQEAPAQRPQALMLTFLGEYVRGRALCVYSRSIIEVLARVGVSEHATRSTLTRMVNGDLLRRQRHGQRMYFGLTERSRRILEDGRHRLAETGAVNRDWDGTWTLLGFSLPGSWQRERHALRSQLAWAGFGPLQNGLWIAVGTQDVEQIVAGLGLRAHVRVFHARTNHLTDVDEMIRDAYDLDGLAVGYAEFLERWDPATRTPPADPFATKLRLVTDWLQTIRRDPRLPIQHLPPRWPAIPAQDLFHRLDARLLDPAQVVAAELLDTRPDTHG